MINQGNRRSGNPVLVGLDNAAIKLKRVPFREKAFYERWLQDLIHTNPEILPVVETAPAFAPLVSIGYEVGTETGSIDLMFISPEGYITIVETKLWRNPEARREVVGQIIEYAKDVSQWSYEELDNKVKSYNQQYRNSDKDILDTIRLIQEVDEEEERFLVDAISRNLSQGRFLLLIVGDGIHESVEAMADYLQSSPQLLFTLALVELQVYDMGDGKSKKQLVVPQVVARTKEVTRAIVRVEGDVKGVATIGVETPSEKPPISSVYVTQREENFFNILRSSVNPEDYTFAKQIIDDMQNMGCIIDWKQASYVVKLTDPNGSGQKLTLFVVMKEGLVYVGWLEGQLKSLNLPVGLGPNYVSDTAKLFDGVSISPTYADNWNRRVQLSEVRSKYSEFKALVAKLINDVRQAGSES